MSFCCKFQPWRCPSSRLPAEHVYDNTGAADRFPQAAFAEATYRSALAPAQYLMSQGLIQVRDNVF
jgi:hypothetical protein